MFGMSWTQIIMIVVIGVFLLGPERIPTAVQWVTGSLKKMRGMAQGAQQQLNTELGPEIAEMRRQIAELQGLKEMQSLKELKDLKDLNPRSMITKTIFGTDEAKTAGGVAGLLGLDPSLLADPSAKPVSAGGPADVTARAADDDAVSFDKSPAPGPTTSDPLPLVGGSQEKVQPADEPDPMPQVEATAEPVPAPAQPAPAVGTADPIPVAQAPATSVDPLPAPSPAAAPAPAPVPSADPLPAAQADPLPGVSTGKHADPVPAAAPPATRPAVSRPAARPTQQMPLVTGGDPLPRISRPDPIPTPGS